MTKTNQGLPQEVEIEDLLNTRQVAELFPIAASTLETLRSPGRGPRYYKLDARSSITRKMSGIT